MIAANEAMARTLQSAWSVFNPARRQIARAVARIVELAAQYWRESCQPNQTPKRWTLSAEAETRRRNSFPDLSLAIIKLMGRASMCWRGPAIRIQAILHSQRTTTRTRQRRTAALPT